MLHPGNIALLLDAILVPIFGLSRHYQRRDRDFGPAQFTGKLKQMGREEVGAVPVSAKTVSSKTTRNELFSQFAGAADCFKVSVGLTIATTTESTGSVSSTI